MNVRRREGKMTGAVGSGVANTVTKMQKGPSQAKKVGGNPVSAPKSIGLSKIQGAVTGPKGG